MDFVDNIKGKAFLVEQSRFAPYFLRLTIGLSEFDTELLYGRYEVAKDGEKDINLLNHREMVKNIKNDYRESWKVFGENLFVKVNGETKLIWGNDYGL